MSGETYGLYLLTLAAFFATPPDTSQLLIISQSLRHGLRRSLWTIAGDLSANSLQMTAAAFGLVALIATSATALSAIKWLGVAYLGWLGLRLLFAPRHATTAPPAKGRQLFRLGFLTSAANPYAVVFFGALFPQFIDPALPIAPQLLLLGATYLVVDGLLLLAWGRAATAAASRLPALTGRALSRASAVLMLAAAALLASKDLQPEPHR